MQLFLSYSRWNHVTLFWHDSRWAYAWEGQNWCRRRESEFRLPVDST